MRYTLADRTLPHQIVLLLSGSNIAVTCNCLGAVSTSAIESRPRWTVPEALEVYEKWHRARVGTARPGGCGGGGAPTS